LTKVEYPKQELCYPLQFYLAREINFYCYTRDIYFKNI